jgi:hypothetical protein
MGGNQSSANLGQLGAAPANPAPTSMAITGPGNTDPSQTTFFGDTSSPAAATQGSTPVAPGTGNTPTPAAANAPVSYGRQLLSQGLSALGKTLGQAPNPAPYRPPQQTGFSIMPTPVAPSTNARYGTSLSNRNNNQNQGY